MPGDHPPTPPPTNPLAIGGRLTHPRQFSARLAPSVWWVRAVFLLLFLTRPYDCFPNFPGSLYTAKTQNSSVLSDTSSLTP